MLSIVIPVYNERESLQTLQGEIVAACAKHGLDVEIVFIDDGSKDGSWQVIQDLVGQRAATKGIRLRRNFGKAAALSAGVRVATGDVLCTMDADLQDDPAELPNLLHKLTQGYDVVSGWKKERHDPWHKRWPSKVFNFLVSWSTGLWLHDHNCGLKCYRKEVFKEIRLYGELHRFIPVLANARGFKVGELVVQHRPRKYGHSKYGVWRFLKGFLDLLTVNFLTGFGRRPAHLLGAIGLLFFFLGSLGLVYLAVIWVLRLFHPDDFDAIHRRPLLTYSAAALILGAQMLSMGILAELITAYQSRDEDGYSIAETIGQPPHSTPKDHDLV